MKVNFSIDQMNFVWRIRGNARTAKNVFYHVLIQENKGDSNPTAATANQSMPALEQVST